MKSLVKRCVPRWPRFVDKDRSSLPARTLREIQSSTFRYRYRGVNCVKNPFDLALYMQLLSDVRPGTIVEVGSYNGGSALWFAAQTRGLGLSTQIYSIDIQPVGDDVRDANVTFLSGDIHRLDDSALPQILRNAARPLFVVEDGPHTFDGCLAALRFFDPYLKQGEYIVIEDGILKDLNFFKLKNGPNRAIRTFLSQRGRSYEIDRSYCDFFGHNVTWNTNGYLRRITSD
jgi:cephalosporin hydroxylase